MYIVAAIILIMKQIPKLWNDYYTAHDALVTFLSCTFQLRRLKQKSKHTTYKVPSNIRLKSGVIVVYISKGFTSPYIKYCVQTPKVPGAFVNATYKALVLYFEQNTILQHYIKYCYRVNDIWAFINPTARVQGFEYLLVLR